MKIITVVVLAFITLTGFSQTNINIGLTFSPEKNFTSASFSDSEWSYYEMEPSNFNYTTGISAIIPLKSSINIGSGLMYSNKDYVGLYYCTVCDFSFNTESLQMEQRFIEIPLFVRYQIVKEKIGLHAETGLTASHQLPTSENEHSIAPNSYSFLLSGQLGIGLDIPLGHNIELSVTTKYSRSLSDFYENSDFRFNALGIATSIMYRFKMDG